MADRNPQQPIKRQPGRPKGTPKTGGRKKGTPNKATVEARAFASSIVDDPKYQANLRKRALAGKLKPQIEAMLWHYAKGKPVERYQFVGDDGQKGLTVNLKLVDDAPAGAGEGT
jgi:hypothetical protein